MLSIVSLLSKNESEEMYYGLARKIFSTNGQFWLSADFKLACFQISSEIVVNFLPV